MSSRLLQEEGAHAVEPMAWRKVTSEDSSGLQIPDGPLTLTGSGQDRERAVEQRLREAHAAGLREGEAAGHRRAAAELQPVIERLARSIDEISGLRARLRREAERDVVQLALAIARRILARELSVDPDAMRGLVLGALERLRSQEISRVRVHPAQEPLVTACLRQTITDRTVDVIADPASERGAVVFETERGSLDASVASQLQEIERGLTDRLRRHS